MSMSYISVKDAATHLGVTEVRVRTLIRNGSLDGHKEGGSWRVNLDSVLSRRSMPSLSRPLSPQDAWNAAACMEGDVDGLGAQKRYRLRLRLTGKAADESLRALSRRYSDVHTFIADPQDIRGVLSHPSAIPTGVSVYEPGSRMVDVCTSDIESLRDDLELIPSSTGNLTVRSIPDGVTLPDGRVPAMIVAADAAEGAAPKYRAKGRKVLEDLSRSPVWTGKVSKTKNNVVTAPRAGESSVSYHDPFSTALTPSQTTALWGKTDYHNSGSREWGLLVTHLSDAGGVAERLWDSWLSNNTRRSVSRGTGLGDELSKKLVVFLTAAHDVGKASPGFERQIVGDSTFAGLATGLTSAGLPLTGKYTPSNGVPRHENVSMFAVARAMRDPEYDIYFAKFLAAVVGAHHGRFPLETDLGRSRPLHGGGYTADTSSTIWVEVQDALVAAAKSFAGITDEEWERIKKATIAPYAVTQLTGIVVMADWISSNTKYFPLGINPPLPSAKRADAAWNDLDLTRGKWSPQQITDSDVNAVFRSRFNIDADPRPIQVAAVGTANSLDSAGLVVIEAPTGVGKTEAALLAAETLANKHGCDGIMFALPTRATSDAAYDRVNQWLESRDKSLGAHLTHGKAEFNEKFTSRLERFEKGVQSRVFDGDVDDDCCGELNTWFSGSRNKHLADFTVGTIDQVLLSSAVGKHVSVRHLGLSGKVLILDEVHASDLYMSSFLVRSLRWLGHMGVPVVALTATLTPSLRRALHNAYSRQDNRHYMPDAIHGTSKLLFPEAEDVNAYPVITSSSQGDDHITETPVPYNGSRDVEVESLQVVSVSDIVSRMSSVVGKSGCSALIFNTVNRAQEAWELLRGATPDSCEILLLHSRFTGVDRSRIERRVLDLTGKSSVRPKHLIVVSTQVIEQSLDVDFDVMYSDLAPIDLLVQRMGRLHRHTSRTNRDPNFGTPKLYVGGYCSEGEGIVIDARFRKWVYSELMLMRTASIIDSITKITEPQDLPSMMRSLDKGVDVPDSWREAYDSASVYHKQLIKDINTNAPFLSMELPKNGNVPWQNPKMKSPRSYTPVRKGTRNVEVVVVYETENGMYLPNDGGPGGGKRIGAMNKNLALNLARRSVPLDGTISKKVRSSGYGNTKRSRIVPLAVLHHEAVPEWESWSALRDLGLLILTPDDESLSSGTGTIGGVNAEDGSKFSYNVTYDGVRGLRRA